MNKTSSAIVRTLLLGTSCLCVLGTPAFANPTGGTVVGGTATITERGPNSTVIDQKTNRALINWDTFSIAAGGTVRFNQPGTRSITLNRVIGNVSSAIYGNLLANGQVWLINGNGILFGGGAKVNVGGLIATTADIADRDFMAGGGSFSGGTGASVVNQGTIRASRGGSVVLSGASVSNQGLIAVDTGTVVLGGASAFTVDFDGDNLLRYQISAPAGQADNGQTGVSNSGTITATNGGRVIMTARAAAQVAGAVVNNTGMISATSAKVQDGEVVLDGGDGDVNVGGTINATGAGANQTGGTVTVTGHNITVADNTQINVSGDAGGGTVRIGGDLHGTGPLQNAANVTVGSATIKADATRRGNGGTLVVWSNGLTDFSGIFSAMGGALGGNGGFIETSGHTLNVGSNASVNTSAPHGKTGNWLLDPDEIIISVGEGGGTPIPPGGTIRVDDGGPESTDHVRPSTIIAALANSNVTLQARSHIEVDDAVIYSSTNALSLMSGGNIDIYASIQNAGAGGINLIAGWDGETAVADILTTPRAYGNDDGEVYLSSSDGNVFVGSAGGATLLAASYVTLYADNGGNVQVGYHGAGGGDINVYATNNVEMNGQDPEEDGTYAMIGNGALDGSVSGAITGNIFVRAEGVLDLRTHHAEGCDCAQLPPEGGSAPQAGGNGRTIGIGNESGIGEAPPTGSVVILAGEIFEDFDANGGLGTIIAADIAYGDTTIGSLDSEGSLFVDGDAVYSSDHALTLLSAGGIDITANLQNAGNGAITLIAGWDGDYDSAHLTDAGHYGLNGSTITVGGGEAHGDASVGTAHGTLSLYGGNLDIAAENGYAQVGYHGAGGGDIVVRMTGDITGEGASESQSEGNLYAMLGNGSLLDDVQGNITGSIDMIAGGLTQFDDGDAGQAWLGNVAGTGFGASGNLTALTADGFFRADHVNGALHNGNVFLGFTDAEVGDIFIGGLTYDSAHDFTFAASGNMNVIGAVANAGSGAVTLVAGWDGHTVGSAAALQQAHAYGNGALTTIGGNFQFQDAAVGSAGGRTTLLTGDLTIAPKAGYYSQVGWHGTGGGDIVIRADGDMSLTGGSAAHDYAMIGNGSLNGDVTGNITGNIDILVGGTTTLTDADAGPSWIGNVAGSGFTATGNVLLVTGDFDGAEGVANMLAADLANGDVTIGITDSEAQNEIDTPVAYNSTHVLNLLTAGSLAIASGVQNAGSGAINVVTGWDGTTFDAAHFGDAGVYGNNSGSLLIGGGDASGNAAVGSFGGTTSVYAANVIVSAQNGYAQIGYHGAGSGAINVTASNGVSLYTIGDNRVALIGNGGLDVGGHVDGAITVSSMGSVLLTADYQGSVAGIGNVSGPGGSEGGDIKIDSHGNALTLSASANAAHTYVGNWNKGNTNGNTSGNITIDSGALTIATSSNGYGHIGNGTFRYGIQTGAVSGNTVIHAASFLGTATSGGQSRVGNLGSAAADGNLSLYTTGDVTASGIGGLVNIGNVSAALDGEGDPAQGHSLGHLLVQAGGAVTLTARNSGNARIEIGGASTGSTIDVTAAGDITLNAGEVNVPGSNSFAMIGALTSGNGGANISVTSTGGGVYLNAYESGGRVLIGNQQQGALGGTMGGTIAVSAANALHGNVGLVASGANSSTQIGNFGDSNETLSGDITIVAGNAVTIGSGNTFLGNLNTNPQGEGTVPAPFTGNVTVSAFSLTGNIAPSLANDLSGGDVLLKIFGPSFALGGEVAYNSTHQFTLLSAGNIALTGNLQNAGTGGITLVAGWNGTTLDAAHLFDAGVYGNNAGSLLVGGANAAGNVAVGSAGGPLRIGANAVTLTGANGYAQLGYHGAAGGMINLNALGAVTLTGGSAANYAWIGNGATFGSNAAGGDVGIAAGSLVNTTDSAVTGANVKLAVAGGNIGSSGTPLRIASATLAVTTNGGNVFLTSPGNGVVFGGSGVNLAGGSFTLAAAGAISQTAAIHTGQANISTTSGNITLTNADNGFGALTIATPGSASLKHSSLLTIASANIGGGLTLDAGTAINQSGAIVAQSLTATAANGTIVLTNAGNSFGALTLTTTGTNDATVTDAVAVALGTSSVGGKLTLNAGGAVSQTGALASHGLAVATTAGGIALTNTGNAVVGTVQFNTPGALAFYNTLATNVGASSVGGDFTLLSKGNINVFAPLQLVNGNIVLLAGWDGTTTNAASFGNTGVYGNNTGPLGGNVTIGGTGAQGAVAVGSQHGSTSIYANNVGIIGVNGYAQLGYHGTGGGAILVRTLHDMTVGANAFTAMIGNGSMTNDVLGNVTGDIDIRLGGNGVFNGGNGSADTWMGNVAHSGTETGNVIFVANDVIGTQDNFSQFLVADIAGGDVTVGFTGTGDQGPDHSVAYNSSHTLNILTAGNFILAGGIQNAGSGAINVVAGWDGHTIAAGSYGTSGVYGNNNKGILIGGADAEGNAALGSFGGTTSVYGTSLALVATHGYAQLGFNGHGSGAINVKTTGGVTLTGGSGANQFAQIGNGGRGTTGNNSGDITISAGGDLTFNAGAGNEAYTQIGHGGAESNSGSAGYSNVAAITVTAANVLLNGGGGTGAYVQIGNGGYKSGIGITGGTATNGGAITVTSGHAVSLLGGGGIDAYVQIGNGGSQSNLNAAAGAGGTTSGTIIVHAPNGSAGSVTVAGGAGANAYGQIGNGGYAVNSGPASVAANWTITGDITVTDLALSGGNSGANSYGAIGNGDASHNSYGNVSGNIVIDANGQITYTNGTAPHSPGTIGNFTGQGTTSGTVTGATPPSEITGDPVVIGVTASNTADDGSPTNGNNNITTIQTIVIVDEGPGGTHSVVTLENSTPGPLAQLDGDNESEGTNASDGATVVIADSLDGAKKTGAQTILSGMLKSAPNGNGAAHGVPPADQNFSSWGNEALWQ